MNKVLKRRGGLILVLMTVLLLWSVQAQAVVDGVESTSFDLVAKQDHISAPDGDSILMWGYALGAGSRMQYPGPTMIVNQGDDGNGYFNKRSAGGTPSKCVHRVSRSCR